MNEDLLFVGTDVGVYASLDRGRSWQRFMTGFPTVPVHDLQIHPRDGELIAGTHGRSIWIVDIEPLQQHSPAVFASAAHLFEPAPAFHFGTSPTGGEFTAQHYFQATNPTYGAEIRYWLGDDVEDRPEVVVENAAGEEVWRTTGGSTRGLHTVTWNLRDQPVRLPRSASEVRDSIAIEKRLAVVVDSLIDAGEDRDDVEEAVERLRTPPTGGGRGFGGGGGRGGLPFTASGDFIERPAEGPAVGGGRGFGGGGGAAAAGGGSLQQRIQQLVRGTPSGRGRGRGRGGGGGLFPGRTEPAPWAEPGRYSVTLTVDGREYTETLQLTRSATARER